MLTARTMITGAIRLASVTAHATSHGDTVSGRGQRRPIASAAAATATTASATADPAGASGTGSALTAAATRAKASRTCPARPANRRSQPRTVSAGTPSNRAIRRCPTPRAAAASADPITPASSGRRASTPAGSSTCVTPHPRHRDRRGRTTLPRRPGPKITRLRACPHGASRPSQPGHARPPSFSIRSTPRASLPTVSTGAPLHPHAALPGASPKDHGEGRPETDTLTVSSSTTPRNHNPHITSPPSLNDASRPLHAHTERRRTTCAAGQPTART